MYASDTRHSSRTLQEKLVHIYTLGRKTINLDFRPEYLNLLAAFGDPHKKLPPVIHVAGTNGKGSIVATLRAILEESGYKVHTYTSPHLIEFNERILLAGQPIKNDFLESLVDEALALNKNNDTTFFELTTALAFAAFSRTPADVLLLEVGLGGRMDCTNIVEKPLVTVISSIGFDHMEFLGTTLPEIAAEKGGIMKPGVPCVISEQSPESRSSGMLEVLAAMAEKKGSLLARHGPEWFTQDLSDRFRFVYNHVEMTLPHPNLQGVHQIANAGAAIAALQIIKDQFPVSDDSIRKGLKKIKWPARLQNLTGQFPLPEGWEIWLDGGHNENAAHALATQTAIWNAQDAKPLHLVLGMMRRKDPAAFVKILRNHLTSVTFIDIPDEPQIISADEGAEILKEKIPDLKTSATMSIETALCDIATANHHTPPGRILIAGSLYLAGHVLKQCGKTP